MTVQGWGDARMGALGAMKRADTELKALYGAGTALTSIKPDDDGQWYATVTSDHIPEVPCSFLPFGGDMLAVVWQQRTR